MDNILVSKFPEAIKIDNKIYEINSDFRTCLKIMLAFEDDELTLNEKCDIMIQLLYKEMPENIELAVQKGIKFLDCGDSLVKKDTEDKRVYSFSKDSKFIYSALKQTHNEDLNSKELHWWQFVFLFMDVNKDCMFSQLVSLRQKKNSGKLTQEERKLYYSLREITDLDYIPEDEEEEEVDEFMLAWNGGDNKDE